MKRDLLSRIAAAMSRPEYKYRPSQVFRRVLYQIRRHASSEVATLSWHVPIVVNPKEIIGSCIARLGIHDLSVCEALARLVDPGDTCVDVGSNIGQMSNLMAILAGGAGTVYSCEPHSTIFRQLEENVHLWTRYVGLAPIFARRIALSDRSGVGVLEEPAGFGSNAGLARLSSGAALRGQQVPLQRLDDVLTEVGTSSVGVLKIDVENHEREVLLGASRFLAAGAIRDVILEDFGEQPSDARRILQGHGYTLFRLTYDKQGPIVRRIDPSPTPEPGGEPDFIATLEPSRLCKRFECRDWRVMRLRPGRR